VVFLVQIVNSGACVTMENVSRSEVGTSRGARGWRKRYLVTGIVAFVLVVGFGILLRIDALGYVPAAQALAPVAGLGLLLLGVIAAVARRWPATVILVVGVVIGGWPLLMPVHDHARSGNADSEQTITVLSLNIEFSGADVTQVAKVIADESVQIAILLECDDAYVEKLAAAGGLGRLPYKIGGMAQVSAQGTVILSAWPLRNPGEVTGGSHFDQPTAQVTVPGIGDVRIAAVHTNPPVPPPRGWYDAVQAVGVWQRAHANTPLIIAGDFNASTSHPVYRKAAAGLTDAAVASPARWLPLPTWRAGSRVPPFTAIDHILVRDLHPVAWRTVAIPGTDHLGVVAKVMA